MSEDRGAKTAAGHASLRRSRSRVPSPLLPYGAGPFASSNHHLPSFRKADAHSRSCDGVTLARINAFRKNDRDLAWLCSIYKRHMATMRAERKHMHRALVAEKRGVLSLQRSVDKRHRLQRVDLLHVFGIEPGVAASAAHASIDGRSTAYSNLEFVCGACHDVEAQLPNLAECEIGLQRIASLRLGEHFENSSSSGIAQFISQCDMDMMFYGAPGLKIWIL